MSSLVGRIVSIRLTFQFIVIAGFFILLKSIYKSEGLDAAQLALFTPATLLFSLFTSFSISNQRNRYNAVFDVDRGECSKLYSIYAFSKKLSKDDHKKIQGLIDNYLIEQLDYKLDDYQNTDDAFTRLADYCIAIQPHNETQKELKSEILSLIPEEQEKRYQLQSLLKERVTMSEWVTVLCLYAATIYFFSQFKTPDWQSILVGALLSTAATMLILILLRFDTLRWNAGNKIWEPLERLFKQLDLLPYYPQPSIDRGEVIPLTGQKIRIASYPHEYPDISEKKVETVIL